MEDGAEPGHPTADANRRFSLPVAGGAEGDQVLKLVSCFPAGEASEGLDVMHMQRIGEGLMHRKPGTGLHPGLWPFF